MVGNNIKACLATAFFGSAGDMFSRYQWYGCSIDKIWTLLFMFPPFSFISAGLYAADKVQSGTSCSNLFDWFFVLIPIIAILLAILIPKLISAGETWETVVFTALMVLTFAAMRVYKYSQLCNAAKPTTTPTATPTATPTPTPTPSTPYGKFILWALLISFVVNVSIVLFNYAGDYAQFVPVLGVFFKVWSMLEIIPGLQHAIMLVGTELVLNLYDNVPENISSMCSST